jgi:hypothetical protein
MDIVVRKTSPLVVEDRSWLGDVDGTQATRSITLRAAAFTKNTHYPNGVLKSGTVLARYTSGTYVGLYGPYAGQASEAQTVTITGSPAGGTFTLTYSSETTAGIAYNATAAAVQSALEALPSLSAGDVTVTGGPGPGTPYVVTFGGRLAGQNVAQMTTSGAGLTGGTTPASAVTTTTAGGGTATDGLDVPRGFLFNSLEFIYADGSSPTGNIGAPLQERGFIRPQFLPANSGLDANARLVLGNHFIFRD